MCQMRYVVEQQGYSGSENMEASVCREVFKCTAYACINTRA
jgi:hypothetical protein